MTPEDSPTPDSQNVTPEVRALYADFMINLRQLPEGYKERIVSGEWDQTDELQWFAQHLAAPSPTPDSDYVLVPRVPTEAMLKAVGYPWKGMTFPEQVESAWRIGWSKMIAARPTPADNVPDPDEDPPCTDCGDTGITYQTERRCACQPPIAPADDAERRAIPEGMVPYSGGGCPDDFESGSRVAYRDGDIDGLDETDGTTWTQTGAPDDIIAYTPKPRDTDARLREAAGILSAYRPAQMTPETVPHWLRELTPEEYCRRRNDENREAVRSLEFHGDWLNVAASMLHTAGAMSGSEYGSYGHSCLIVADALAETSKLARAALEAERGS